MPYSMLVPVTIFRKIRPPGGSGGLPAARWLKGNTVEDGMKKDNDKDMLTGILTSTSSGACAHTLI